MIKDYCSENPCSIREGIKKLLVAEGGGGVKPFTNKIHFIEPQTIQNTLKHKIIILL